MARKSERAHLLAQSSLCSLGILTKKYLGRRTVFVFLGGIPAFRGVRFEAPGWDLRERPAEDERGGSRPKLSHAA